MFVIERETAGQRWWLAVEWTAANGRWTDEERGRVLFCNVKSARSVIRLARDLGEKTDGWTVVDTKAGWWPGYLKRVEAAMDRLKLRKDRKHRRTKTGGAKGAKDADAVQAVLPGGAERPTPLRE